MSKINKGFLVNTEPYKEEAKHEIKEYFGVFPEELISRRVKLYLIEPNGHVKTIEKVVLSIDFYFLNQNNVLLNYAQINFNTQLNDYPYCLFKFSHPKNFGKRPVRFFSPQNEFPYQFPDVKISLVN